MNKTLIALLCVLTVSVCGCEVVSFFAYVFAPEPPKKEVKAAFGGLEDHSVALVVFTDEQVNYEYPLARLDLATIIAVELQQHVPNIGVIDPRKVAAYQMENIHWDGMDKTELGRTFDADYVLFVTVERFTTLEPGSTNLHRGRLNGTATVYRTSLKEREACVWPGADFEATFPEDIAEVRIVADDRRIQYETMRIFAAQLVRKFYDHKVDQFQ